MKGFGGKPLLPVWKHFLPPHAGRSSSVLQRLTRSERCARSPAGVINRPSSVSNELPASRLPLACSQRGLWRQVRVAALHLFADTGERRRGCGAAARIVVIYRFSEAFESLRCQSRAAS